MPEDPGLDHRITELTERLRRVEERLAVLERSTPPPEVPTATATATAAPVRAGEIVPLVGRTIVILGGAFLLRALTEWGVLLHGAGLILGFLYAFVWVALTDFEAGRSRAASAAFHGIAAAVIGYPLIWESTVRFEFLGPAAAAAALLVFTAAALVVAWRRRLRPVPWIFCLGAAATALGLTVTARAPMPFACGLFALGLAVLWAGESRKWAPLAWTLASVVDVWVILMTVMVLAGRVERVREVLDPRALVALQLSLVVFYVGTFIVRTTRGDRDIRLGEIMQGVAALVIGGGGALAVTRSVPLPGLPLGIVSLVLAAGAYAGSFTVIERRAAGRKAFIFLTSLALAFTLAAVEELLGGWSTVLALAVAAVFAAWTGWKRGRATLSLHGAVYALAAMAASGVLPLGARTLYGPPVDAGSWLSVTVPVALVAAAACCVMPVAMHGRTWGRFTQVPKLVVLTALVLGVDGAITAAVSTVLPGAEEAGTSLAPLTAARTGVVSLSAVVLAWIGRAAWLPQAAWLVYPVLLAGGARLLLEDIQVGRPSTLVVSLALYGGALVLAPRLARRVRGPSGASEDLPTER